MDNIKNSFDIFISYKRKSLPTANNLYYRLTTRGYTTFFDLEEMGRENFNTQLLTYIERANDVFVILEEGSLTACLTDEWEKDWFCQEVAYALEKKKNIIPILLGGFQMPPEDFFPEKLKELTYKNAPTFDFSYFEAYLDKLIEKNILISKPNVQTEDSSVFKFYSDADCQVFKEGKLVCSLKGMSDEPYYLLVNRKGDYRFKVINEETSQSKVIREHIDIDEEKEIDVAWTDSANVVQQPAPQSSPQPSPQVQVQTNVSMDKQFENAYQDWLVGEYGKAFPLFAALAEKGYKKAYGYVGLCYELGQGVQTDLTKAEYFYNLAIDAKDYLGVYRLGMIYSKNAEYYKAIWLYEKTISEGWADGDASCHCALGEMLESSKEFTKAFMHYKIAAERGHGIAMFKLADFYENGLGIKQDINSAISWYEKCAKSNFISASDARDRLRKLRG